MTDTTSPPDATSAPSPRIRTPRRIATFYPDGSSSNKPSKPFSRSAAKRDSVMALGSIEHLQHYFTKNGLAQKRRTHNINKMLVPALGPSVIPTVHLSDTPSIVELPPSPAVPAFDRPSFPRHERTYEADPEALKPGVISDLNAVEKAWGIGVYSRPKPTTSPRKDGKALLTAINVKQTGQDTFDVLSVLQITTRAIRTVRNYLVALPDDHPFQNRSRRDEAAASLRKHSQSRLRVVSPQPGTSAATPSHPDRLTKIRKTALDVLAALRSIEESNRIPLSDDVYDCLSVGSGGGDLALSVSDEFIASSGGSSAIGERRNSLFSGDEEDNDSLTSGSNSAAGALGFTSGAPTLGTTKAVPLKGRPGIIHVWDDGEEDEFQEPDEQKREAWDERLVLGGGWLYKQIQLSSLQKEREVVARYLDMVDQAVFGRPYGASLPLSRESSSTSDGDARSEGSEPFEHSLDEPIPRAWRLVASPKPRRVSSRSSLGGRSPTPAERSPVRKVSDVAASARTIGLLGAALTDEPQSTFSRLSDLTGWLQTAEGEEGSEGEGEDEGEWLDEELPDWARRDKATEDALGRLHPILVEHLPPEYLSHLPDPVSDRAAFLARLSDGQLLCLGYNAVVRKSWQPWGFIGGASIHDIIGLETKELQQGGSEKRTKSSWTFRRTENLRLWAAALKLRYMVALTPNLQKPSASQPSSPISSVFTSLPDTSQKEATSVVSVASPPRYGERSLSPMPPTPSKVLAAMELTASYFEPRVIAKRDEGWEEMFEGALGRWVDVIVKERREKPKRR